MIDNLELPENDKKEVVRSFESQIKYINIIQRTTQDANIQLYINQYVQSLSELIKGYKSGELTSSAVEVKREEQNDNINEDFKSGDVKPNPSVKKDLNDEVIED